MKIKVMIDSAADISLAEEKEKNVPVARFALTINGKEYLDEIDISLEQFKEHLYGDSDMTTSQTPIGVLVKMWDEILVDYDHIIYITLSKKLSGAYQSAYAASLDYDGKITVLDANVLAYPLQVTYESVLSYVEQGKSIEEIKDLVENHEPMFAFLIPHDLKHLKKGGRISPQAATLANLLKIVPILALEDGVIDAHDKVRTNKKAIEKAINEIIEKYPNADEYHWFILHSDLEDSVMEYKDIIEKETKQEVLVKNLHPILLTHAGPKTFAVATLRKYPKN